jgi:hypothetical protein
LYDAGIKSIKLIQTMDDIVKAHGGEIKVETKKEIIQGSSLLYQFKNQQLL